MGYQRSRVKQRSKQYGRLVHPVTRFASGGSAFLYHFSRMQQLAFPRSAKPDVSVPRKRESKKYLRGCPEMGSQQRPRFLCQPLGFIQFIQLPFY